MSVLRNRAFSERAAPFLAAGVLAPVDVHVPDALGPLVGEADPEVLLGLAFAVRATRHGHVGAGLASLRETVIDTGSADDAEALRALPWPERVEPRLRDSGLVGGPGDARPFVLHAGLLYTWRYWRYQERLREALLRRADAPGPDVDEALLREGLAALFPPGSDAPPGPDLQRLGALMAVLRPFTVISGGPGTGKTFTVKKVLGLLHAQFLAAEGREPRVALAAPTGKAAVRMTQAIREELHRLHVSDAVRDFLLAQQATTLHRLLGWQPRNTSRFKHGLDRPLPHDVVIVDEASMVDLAMMCKLVEAVRPDARLVLLGDRNQLASVEAGSVLADLTSGAGPAGLRFSPALAARLDALDAAPGVPADPAAPALADGIVHLKRPYRFLHDSGIADVAYAIADARLDQAVALLAGGARPDLALISHGADGALGPDALALLVGGYVPYLEVLEAGPELDEDEPDFHRRALIALDAFRVLAAHRRGRLGVAGLNEVVQGALAKRGLIRPRGAFWAGRPVLVTENSYETGRTNGDVGLVVSRADGALAVAFPGVEVGRVDYLAPARMPSHETVFAMTIHKSQGSQHAHPVVVLPSRPSPLLTRELLYTAITRASERVTVVGEAALLRDGLERTVQRASGLAEMLWGGGG